MSKIALTVAAVLIAGTTLSSAANAGGLRLGFGFPLGSFVAKPFQGSSNHIGNGYKKKHEAPQYAAQRAPKKAAPKVQVAETPAARKATKPVEVKTATVETKSTTSDAPAVFVPETPATKTEVKQVTVEKLTTTAAIAPETTSNIKVEDTNVEKIEKVEVEEPKNSRNNSTPEKQVCRKFSALVGGMVEVPCE